MTDVAARVTECGTPADTSMSLAKVSVLLVLQSPTILLSGIVAQVRATVSEDLMKRTCRRSRCEPFRVR